MDPTEELKIRAKRLLKAVREGDSQAEARLRRRSKARLDAPPPSSDELQHKHCLDVVAVEHGFADWRHATTVLSGDHSPQGFGTLLGTPHMGGFLNVWFASYDAAAEHLRENGGYLLPYAKQFVVVGSDYVRDVLRLDPADPHWAALEHDWLHPKGAARRRALYGQVIAARPRAG